MGIGDWRGEVDGGSEDLLMMEGLRGDGGGSGDLLMVMEDLRVDDDSSGGVLVVMEDVRGDVDGLEGLLRGEEIGSSFLSYSRSVSLSVESPSRSKSSPQNFLACPFHIWSWKLAIASGVVNCWLGEEAVVWLPTVVE